MPFDMAAFERAEFRPRTERISVPALAAFFAEGEAAEWEVRSLTATELHRAHEAGRRQRDLGTVVDALATAGDRAQELRKVLGLATSTPAEVAKLLEMLVAGSVSPKIELHQAVKLADTFPVEFLQLTTAITSLTGQGFDLVKPGAASHQTPASSAS